MNEIVAFLIGFAWTFPVYHFGKAAGVRLAHKKLFPQYRKEVLADARKILFDHSQAVSEPRAVTSAEELDALPIGSVVLTPHGIAFQQQFGGDWYEASSWDGRMEVDDELFRYGPLVVLHDPEQAVSEP